jgi:hypothetical protein
VVIDVSGLSLTKPTFLGLDELADDIRILGVEGQIRRRRRPSSIVGAAKPTGLDPAGRWQFNRPAGAGCGSLLIDALVRSGQAIVHPDGDVTIVGRCRPAQKSPPLVPFTSTGRCGESLGWRLRQPTGEDFCRRLDAELIAIDGHYIVADEVEPTFAAIQAWLEGDELKIIPN